MPVSEHSLFHFRASGQCTGGVKGIVWEWLLLSASSPQPKGQERSVPLQSPCRCCL